MTNTTIPMHLANNYTDNLANNYTNNSVYFVNFIFTIVMYSIALVLGVTGNGMVIFITGFRMKMTVNTVWFLNLAVADFIFSCFLSFSIVHIALGVHWPFGLAMCKINSGISQLNMYGSVYLLMVISIDRCISVRLPVWAQNNRTPRLASFVVFGVWILALVLSSPRLYTRHTEEEEEDPNKISCFDNVTDRIHQIINNIQFTFAFIIPFGVILCSYGAIIWRLKRNKFSPSNKPFKVITAVIVTFFVCWFPFYVFALLHANLSKDSPLYERVRDGLPLTYSIACLNSSLNPILYVFMGHDFKQQLRKSIFSAFENAFTEQSNANTTETKSSLTYELESQRLSAQS